MAGYLLRLSDEELEAAHAKARAEGTSVATLCRVALGLAPAKLGRPPQTTEAELRGLENVAEAMHEAAAERIAEREIPRFGCPDSRCDFRSKSLAAKCPSHGRSVVPV